MSHACFPHGNNHIYHFSHRSPIFARQHNFNRERARGLKTTYAVSPVNNFSVPSLFVFYSPLSDVYQIGVLFHCRDGAGRG